MRITVTMGAGGRRGSAVFPVGRYEVSVSNVDDRGSTVVFEGQTCKAAKEFFGDSADTVARAIRWAQRAERRAARREGA